MLITIYCVIRSNTEHVEMLIILHICPFFMSFDSMDDSGEASLGAARKLETGETFYLKQPFTLLRLLFCVPNVVYSYHFKPLRHNVPKWLDIL